MNNENDRCFEPVPSNDGTVRPCNGMRGVHLNYDHPQFEQMLGHPFTPAPQASQPVCEHNHTVRHTYAHIPQGYDECSLCGATRVEGEDWRTPTPAATEPSQEQIDNYQDLIAHRKEKLRAGVMEESTTPAATEGERVEACFNCGNATDTEDNGLCAFCYERFQPTETEVTG